MTLRGDNSMRIKVLGITCAFLATSLFSASPPSGTINPTAGSSVAWDGFPGPAVIPDALTLSSNADANCTDGSNCDVFTLKLAPGDWSGKRARFQVTWSIPTDDYDVYVRAGSLSGAVVAKSAGSPPSTIEQNVWDINGVVTAGVNDTYIVHVVYYTVGPLDPYHGIVSVENIPAVIVRTPLFVRGNKTKLAFSKSHSLYANGTTSGLEPSTRVDSTGNAYVGSIRGLTGGNDVWRLDLNPNSSTYDPFLNRASASIDANGNVTNPAYKGQADATSPDPDTASTPGDGGGDMDIAVGFKPRSSAPGDPSTVAATSLTAANISAARSFDRADTFAHNPIGNITMPEDDRNWMEFYGGDVVYLGYREFAGLQATAKFYVNRSDDGGLTYGPAVLAAQGGNTTGNVSVDQNDGTVYFVFQGPGSANKEVHLAVGHPAGPGLAPTQYTTYVAATGGGATIAALFPCVKVAKDGTVYVAYSDAGTAIFIAHSKDQGKTWSVPVRASDLASPSQSLFPWMAVGDQPGSVALAWFGAEAADSEDGLGLNNDNANWKVFFSETFDATAINPTFYTAVASDHFVHGSNISLGGFGGTANRNLADFFQLAIDPQGLALFAFSDDSNDFTGNAYVIHQVDGFSLNSGKRSKISSNLDRPPATDPSLPQVLDQRHDAQTRTVAPTIVNDDSPVDIINIRYGCQASGLSTLLTATMQLSGLTFVPLQGIYRVSFVSNPSKPGVSDRGDQWFLSAETSSTGVQSFWYGTAVRNGDGSVTYTKLGPADFGAFDTTNSRVTLKVNVAKLNGVATRGAIGAGTNLIGLRGRASAVYNVVANTAAVGVIDQTRGGTSYTIPSACP
jgi:hypothetical protein